MTKNKNRNHLPSFKSSRIDFSLPAKLTAFTLAEVLITLGIIGVVAAITIPGLINNYKAHVLQSKFFKMYSTVNQVVRRMIDEERSFDPHDYWIASSGGYSFYKEFARYLQGVTVGKSSSFKYNYKGVHIYLIDDGIITLQDGTVLMFQNENNSNYILVTVDLNGNQNPPNRAGYDTFTFQLTDGDLKTMGDKGTIYSNTDTYCDFEKLKKVNTIYSNDGIACAQLAKENTEYFKKAVRELK